MNNSDFADIGKNVKIELNKILGEPIKTFFSDMRKNIKILSQDMQKLISPKKQLVKLYNDVLENNEKELNDSPFQREMVINQKGIKSLPLRIICPSLL